MAAPPERFWEDLLLFIEEGKVIPLIGRELITIQDGEKEVPLYSWLANRLVASLDLDAAELPNSYGLNEVVSLHVRKGGEREDLYSRLLSILRSGQLKPSKSLLSLAAITDFRVFVSLTFDSLLADAIRSARPGIKPDQVAYATNSNQDLPDASVVNRNALVFHLLGKASSSPEYAICDEDLLEFLHALQDRQRRPVRLFDELRTHHLLFIGCGFDDWLVRFFLRTTRGMEFSQKRRRWDVIADSHSARDSELAAFLSTFSSEIKLFDISAIDFVNELAGRWHNVHAANSDGAPPRSIHGETQQADVREGAIFISYASEDVAAAENIAHGLRAANLDVWFDKRQLQAGDNWSNSIERGIQRCSLFLPVVSQKSLSESNRRRYFWREWNIAADRALEMAPDEEFIVPIIIDGTRLDASFAPGAFKRKQGVTLDGGEITSEVAQRVTGMVRDYYRRQGGKS